MESVELARTEYLVETATASILYETPTKGFKCRTIKHLPTVRINPSKLQTKPRPDLRFVTRVIRLDFFLMCWIL
jgi:hypothetical protein